MHPYLIRNLSLGLIIGLLALIPTLYGFGKSVLAEEGPLAESGIPREILKKAELDKNRNWMVAYGSLEMNSSQDLMFQSPGLVARVFVQAGDSVRAGQILACLENAIGEAQIAQAEAAYSALFYSYEGILQGASEESIAIARSQIKIAEYQLDALKDLEDLDMATREQIKIQEEILKQNEIQMDALLKGADEFSLKSQVSLLAQADASRKAAYAAYEHSILRAPFSGEVTSFNIKEGELAGAAQSVGYILNSNVGAEIITYLSLEEANSIDVKNAVRIHGSNKMFDGMIIGISSTVDPLHGKRKVRILVEDEHSMLSGETLKVEIVQSKFTHVTLVPLSALSINDDKAEVFLYDSGYASVRTVELGKIYGDFAEVSGLTSLPLIKVAQGIKDGDKISPIN